jgi:prepilin-type N-terminal cleavage/methylation domain-containing protein
MITNERGFSLAELLVALAVVTLVLAGALGLQQQGQSAYLTGAARVEVQQNARVALDMMMGEIRSARSITTVTNCNNAGSGTDDITFNDQNNAAVRYRRNGTNLERNNVPVIGGVQALRIWCYESDGVTLTQTAADVRTIRVSVSTQTERPVSAGSASNQHANVEARTRLRNIL